MSKGRLQFLHHIDVFPNREEAYNWLNNLYMTGIESLAGEPITAKYIDASGITQLILAIGKDGEGGEGKTTKYHYIDSAFIDSTLKSEIDRAIKKDNELQEQITSNKVVSADNSIKVTTTSTGTNIETNIDNASIIKDSVSGTISSGLKIKANTEPSDPNVKIEYNLVDSKDTIAAGSVPIKIYKDSALIKAYLGKMDDTIDPETGIITPGSTGDTALCLIYTLFNGKYNLVKINVELFICKTQFKDGLTVNDRKEVSVLIASDSEAFLTVGPAGIKLSGVQTAINEERNRALMAENQLSVDIQKEVAERNAAIATEKSRAEVVENYLSGSIYTLTDKHNELKTNLYADKDNNNSIKHIILTDTIFSSMVTAEPVAEQTLLRETPLGKVYASNSTKDMFHKTENLEKVIDDLVVASGKSEEKVEKLEQAIVSATTRIEKLESGLTILSGVLVTVIETMEETIKTTIANILKGTPNEIKVNTTDINNIKIGFTDDAIFGPTI